MRNIAACYSEQAVKVADSYCSTYPNTRSYVSPKPPNSSHLLPQPQPISQTQTAVTCTYKAKLTPTRHIHITITWSPKLTRRGGFWIRFSDRSKPTSHRIATEKGKETFCSFGGSKIDLHWDLSSAKYKGTSPVPVTSFYLAVLIDSELCLLLGDMGEDDPIVQKLVIGAQLETTALVSQCEHIVSGLAQITTQARFSNSGPTHELHIKCESDVEPSLSVLIDGRCVVTVKRLRWNFRGNQVVFVDGLLVDVMWDVQRFVSDEFQNQQQGRLSMSGSSSSSSGRSSSSLSGVGCDGVFLFRTRSGLDSRLWLEEERLAEKNHDKVEFSFVICASRS